MNKPQPTNQQSARTRIFPINKRHINQFSFNTAFVNATSANFITLTLFGLLRKQHNPVQAFLNKQSYYLKFKKKKKLHEFISVVSIGHK